jgi:hypothetical protein
LERCQGLRAPSASKPACQGKRTGASLVHGGAAQSKAMVGVGVSTEMVVPSSMATVAAVAWGSNRMK